jgi:hypothetical protein
MMGAPINRDAVVFEEGLLAVHPSRRPPLAGSSG